MDTNHGELEKTDLNVNKEAAPKKKRWWTFLKTTLGYVLPILIVAAIPITIWILNQSEDEEPDLTSRQETLEENWEEFQERGTKLGYTPVDPDLFDLALCPFGEDSGSWDIYRTPEEVGMICGYVSVPLYHDQPDGDMIRIAVAIWPTYHEPHYPDPLFITQGGPGGSTLTIST